jgi:hypothetical protein
MVEDGLSDPTIALRFGLCREQVGNIRRRKHWRSVE